MLCSMHPTMSFGMGPADRLFSSCMAPSAGSKMLPTAAKMISGAPGTFHHHSPAHQLSRNSTTGGLTPLKSFSRNAADTVGDLNWHQQIHGTTKMMTSTGPIAYQQTSLPTLNSFSSPRSRDGDFSASSSDLSCSESSTVAARRKTVKGVTSNATINGAEPQGAKRKRCKVEWCGKYAQQGGACIRHGARKKLCSVGSCQKRAVKSGVCVAHGAKVKRCNFPGCQKRSVKSGVCIAHGAKVNRCSIDGCEEYARKGRGLCVAHGGVLHASRCSVAGCSKFAKADDRCLVHSRQGEVASSGGSSTSTAATNATTKPATSSSSETISL